MSERVIQYVLDIEVCPNCEAALVQSDGFKKKKTDAVGEQSFVYVIRCKYCGIKTESGYSSMRMVGVKPDLPRALHRDPGAKDTVIKRARWASTSPGME